jgi:hypothetical protein
MPLSKKGRKVLAAMTKTYGDADKAKRVMYSSINAGRLSGVDPTYEKRRKKK